MPVLKETRCLRFLDGYSWEGVEREAYKPGKTEESEWQGIVRHVLIGKRAAATSFHLRYFEIVPGGYSSLEKHGHAHVVVTVRGRGRAVIDGAAYDMHPFDTLYVAPWSPHQFLTVGNEPFGFFCIVDAERDRPQPLSEQERAIAVEAGALSRS